MDPDAGREVDACHVQRISPAGLPLPLPPPAFLSNTAVQAFFLTASPLHRASCKRNLRCRYCLIQPKHTACRPLWNTAHASSILISSRTLSTSLPARSTSPGAGLHAFAGESLRTCRMRYSNGRSGNWNWMLVGILLQSPESFVM